MRQIPPRKVKRWAELYLGSPYGTALWDRFSVLQTWPVSELVLLWSTTCKCQKLTFIMYKFIWWSWMPGLRWDEIFRASLLWDRRGGLVAPARYIPKWEMPFPLSIFATANILTNPEERVWESWVTPITKHCKGEEDIIRDTEQGSWQRQE